MRTAKSLKSDLHNGFVVKTRGGELFAVVRVGHFEKMLVNCDRHHSIKSYQSNLLVTPGVLNPDMDVMEIYGLVRRTADPYEALRVSTRNRPLLWKRREDLGGVNHA